MNNTQIGFFVSIAMLLVLAFIFIRTPKDGDSRCSYDGGASPYKKAAVVIGAVAVGGGLLAVLV